MSTHEAHAVLAHKSKSFALAARLLPARCRDDVAVLYAYCRYVDDAIDEAEPGSARERVGALTAELDAVYRGAPQSDPLLAEFQRVVVRHAIPEAYPRALLEGMRSDVGRVRIGNTAELVLYAHRVAGVVGLMLCHVFGVVDRRALVHANDLGIGMQLTNICRDVAEDAARDRIYLPADALAECGAASPAAGDPRSLEPAVVARTVQRLLALAERYYASGDAGISALPFRVALAVRAARLVYAAIGREIAARGYAVLAGRAVVPRFRKLRLVARAVVTEVFVRCKARLLGPPPLGAGVNDAL